MCGFGLSTLIFYLAISYEVGGPDGIEFVETLRGLGVHVPQELIDTKNTEELSNVIFKASLMYRVILGWAFIPILSALWGMNDPKPVKPSPPPLPTLETANAVVPDAAHPRSTIANPSAKKVRFGGFDEALKANQPSNSPRDPPDPFGTTTTKQS